MQTVIQAGNEKAVKKWATSLASDVARMVYFKKFIKRSMNAMIEEKIDLVADQGDEIVFDLSMRFRGDPTYGDNRIEGKEEELRFYQDRVKIDQIRHASNSGGRMTRKRTIHDLRKICRDLESEWFAEIHDELMFAYLSGGIGANPDTLLGNLPAGGFAGNAFTAPDAAHITYGGSATSKATLTAADKMSVELIERTTRDVAMLNAKDRDTVAMRPVRVEGGDHYVVLMSPLSEYNLRTSANTSGTGAHSWAEIARAAAGAMGSKSPIFNGAMGKINNVVLHSHPGVRRFTDYGAGGNVQAERALFLGRQAGVVAYGAPEGTRMTWHEEPKDGGNSLNVYCGAIMGMKKTRFNDRDFGVMAMDVAAAA